MSFLRHYYQYFIKIGILLQSPLLLVIRLFWGWQFFWAGLPKLLALNDIAVFFERLGIPFPFLNALLAGSIEMIGGGLLLLGLFARLISLPLAFTMIVAFLTAENAAVRMILQDPLNLVVKTPFSFLLASLIIFVFGPGIFSLDYLMGLDGNRDQNY